MKRSQPFGFPRTFGFGDGRHSRGRYPIEYFYSIGMQHSLLGISTGYAITKKKDTSDIGALGNPKWFADNGTVYCQDDSGNTLKENTPGAGDFAIDHTATSSNGAGLLADAQGRILSFRNSSIDLKTGGSWTDGWQIGLYNWQHPADIYEGNTIFGNGYQVGFIDSADVMNLSAFTLPVSMRVDCLKSGKNGVLLGANLGLQGYLILWDAGADRSIAPWIPTSGKVQSIARTDSGWIVITQKEILITNGYTTRSIFPLLDDPLGFNQYVVAPQGSTVQNNRLMLLQQSTNNARMKPGLYIFDLGTTLMEFVPMSTGNTNSVTPLAIYSAKVNAQEILIGFQDVALGTNTIGALGVNSATSGTFIAQVLASSEDDKAAEAIILNLGFPTSISAPQTLSFTVAAKIYNFRRPLWGTSVTNAVAADGAHIRVNGSLTTNTVAQLGDEVTVLEGPNAGKVAHISAIANAGSTTETWTLDTTLPNVTGTTVHLQIQPFALVEKKTITSVAQLGEFYFNVRNQTRGKKFLTKLHFDDMTNVQLELHSGEFVYDDLGNTT
jgi:hypothetical protein